MEHHATLGRDVVAQQNLEGPEPRAEQQPPEQASMATMAISTARGRFSRLVLLFP